MSTFVDKKGRCIVVYMDGESAYAYHDDRQVGFVTTTGLQEIDDYTPMLPAQVTGWEVANDYRRAGIATMLVRVLVEELGRLVPANQNVGIGGLNALTDDGERLTAHCQRLGLIHQFSGLDAGHENELDNG